VTAWQGARVRVAFIGKGGSGKSAIGGVFCRLLARETGKQVVAIDSDPLPGLALSLGIPSDDTPLPPDLLEKTNDGSPNADDSWQLRDGMSAIDAVHQYAAEGPDGVRLLQFGKLHGHVRTLAGSQQAFRVIVGGLEETDAHLVGDLPGGTRQPFFGWGDFADVLVVVAEATPSSMLSAKRLARVRERARGGDQTIVAVANKAVDPSDSERLAEASGLRVIGAVPKDPAMGAAERAGRSLLDHSPDAPAVEAVRSLLATLQGETR